MAASGGWFPGPGMMDDVFLPQGPFILTAGAGILNCCAILNKMYLARSYESRSFLLNKWSHV